MKRTILSVVIVLMLVMTALLAANLSPIDADNGELFLECSPLGPITTTVGDEVYFSASAWGGVQPYSWSWTVDGELKASFNNTISTNFTWAFNQTGLYEVCVNVTDSSGPAKERQCCKNVTVVGPSLAIAKTDDPDPVDAGGTLIYAISVNNTGVANATGVTIVDDYDETVLNITDDGGGLDNGDTITWTGGITIASGGSSSYNITATVSPTAIGGYTFNNTANVTCAQGVSNSTSINTTVTGVPVPPLFLECSPPGPFTTTVGDAIYFSASAWGGVQPYSWLWTIDGDPKASFYNTDSTNFTWTFNTTGLYEVCVNVTDSAEPANERLCCRNVTVVSPSLTIVKTDDPDPVNAGGTLIYTITVNNTGVANATGVIIVDDYDENILTIVNAPYGVVSDPPDTVTWNGGITIASGGSSSYNITATVSPTAIGGSTFNNTANVTCAQGVSNFTSINTTVAGVPVPPLFLECSPPGPITITVGHAIYFSASAWGGVQPYLWSWTVNGAKVASFNNTISTNITWAFNQTGLYEVCVNVTDSAEPANERLCCKNVTVNPVVPPPPGGGGGGGGCPDIKYLTVDWDGHNTTERLRGNDELEVDLLGPSPDGCHSLLLDEGTHAPIVDEEIYYLITIRELELEDIPPLPGNTMAIVAVDIIPTGAVFNKDIILTLCFDRLPENALNVTINYYDGVSGVWVPLKSTQGERDGMLTISAPLRHFTVFAVLAELTPTPPPPSAHFVHSGLNIETSVEKIWESVTFVTKIGESVTITANVLNDGGQEGTDTVELKLDGETVETKTMTLGAGQSQQVSFTVSGLDYGQHEVEVAGLSDEFTTSRTITWWLIIVIIVAIGLIIWGVVWWRRKRRKAQQAP